MLMTVVVKLLLDITIIGNNTLRHYITMGVSVVVEEEEKRTATMEVGEGRIDPLSRS